MSERSRAMVRSAASKVLSALVVMFLAATVTFLLVRISGDPLSMLLPPMRPRNKPTNSPRRWAWISRWWSSTPTTCPG